MRGQCVESNIAVPLQSAMTHAVEHNHGALLLLYKAAEKLISPSTDCVLTMTRNPGNESRLLCSCYGTRNMHAQTHTWRSTGKLRRVPPPRPLASAGPSLAAAAWPRHGPCWQKLPGSRTAAACAASSHTTVAGVAGTPEEAEPPPHPATHSHLHVNIRLIGKQDACLLGEKS